MARTTINSLGIPADTIVSADLDYPLTDFSSTGIDDNATGTILSIDSSGNSTFVGPISQTNANDSITLKLGRILYFDRNARSYIIAGSSTDTQGEILLQTGGNSTAMFHNTGDTQFYGDVTVDGTFTSTGIDDNATSTAITIDASENVGIGTASPSKPLHVLSTNSGATTTPLLLQNNQGAADGAVEIRLAPTGYPNDIGSTARWSAIRAINGGTGNPTELAFLTNNTSADPVEHMRIDSSGNVGIGETNPDTRLHVTGTTSNYAILAEQPSGYAGLALKSTTVNQTWSFLAQDNGSNSDLHLYGGSSAGIKMTIDSSGKVGIGTTSPAYKLSVHADAVGTTYPLKIENSNVTSGNGVALLFTHRAHSGDNQGSIEYVGAGTNNTNSMLFKTEASGVNGMAERMRIDSSGKLLVGTTSNPDNRFDLATNPNAGRGAELGRISMGRQGSGYPHIGYNAGPTGTNGFVNKYIADTSSWIHFSNGSIIFNRDTGTTAAGAIAGTESMRINSDGNVGIGGITPAYSLHISEGATTDIVAQSTGANGTRAVMAVDNTAMYLGTAYSSSNVPLYFGAGWTGSDLASKFMTLDASGNVGIGTTSPNTSLTVSASSPSTYGVANFTAPVGNDAYVVINRGSADNGGLRVQRGGSIDGAFYVTGGEAVAIGYNMSDTGDSLLFRNGSSNAEVARLDSSGNLGIGATSPAGPLHIQSATNRTLILDGTFATGSYTWQSVRRSGTEKWRWFLESDDDISLYGDVNSVGELMRWSSDGQVYINRSSSISSGTSSKLCITGNIDIDGNPGSTNVIRLYQSATEMGQLYAHTTGVRSYLFSGNVFSIKGQADATIRLEPGSGVYNPSLQWCGQGGNITVEGFEIWYDNDVGDVHLNTTYDHANAAIKFHTRTAASQSSLNERFRINGSGGVQISNTVAGDYILNADHTSFNGRMAAFPGRFIIGPNGNSYPDIGYNFVQTTGGGTNTKIAGDTSYKINFGNGGKFTFSSSGSAAAGSNITWSDVMTITNGAFVGIGSNATSPIVPLHVHAQQNNYGAIAARSGNHATMWSILPWSSAITYMSSGVYYANNSWVHQSDTAYNCLFGTSGSSGIRWYASSSSSGSWNLAQDVQLFNSSGQLTASSASDERLKENIVDYTIADALTKVNALRPVSFEWNDTIKRKKGTEYADGTHVGFIAQEVETVFPEACLVSDTDQYDADSPFDMDPDDTYYGDIKGVRAEKMVPILVGAIKELTRRLEILENA